jgi:hypothetical protein
VTEQSGREMSEENGRPFLPAKDGSLSYWAISQVVKKSLHSGMWVVPVQGANTGASFQVLSAVEIAAKDPVGGGTERNREGDEPFQGPGSVCGRAGLPADSGLPSYH